MTDKKSDTINKGYITAVTILTIVLPFICTVIELKLSKDPVVLFALAGKWFTFSAVGLRLLLQALSKQQILLLQQGKFFILIR